MARLKKEEKIYIVRSLAVFNTPKQTADLIQQDLKIEVSPQQCESYDPTKRSGQNLSSELKTEFEATRKAFLNTPQNIPIANLSVRLQHYQHILERVGKNSVLAMKVLEQAAKDVGGQFTNKQDLTTNGESLNSQKPTIIELVAPNDKSTN